jgi:hypothetical protein
MGHGMEMHPDAEALAFLLGVWAGEGRGEYPTITPFAYREEVQFTHIGKPFLVYSQRTWALDDGRPLHAETGYLRAVGGTQVELVLAHPNGITEIATGAVTGTTLDLRATTVARTPTAKDVSALTRRFEVSDGVLRYQLAMAAMGEPLTHHLAAELKRQ